MSPLCKCGCGQEVKRSSLYPKRWNEYINGHGRKGRKTSIEHRRKISEATKGRDNKHSPGVEKVRCEKISKAMKGRKSTAKQRETSSLIMKKLWREEKERMLGFAKKGRKMRKMYKNPAWNKSLTKYDDERIMSISNKLKELYKDGSNAPAWKGGISFLPYPVEFNAELKRTIKKRDNYACQLCGKKAGNFYLCVHHIDYNKKNSSKNNLTTLCSRCHGKTNKDRLIWKSYFTYETKKYDYIVNYYELKI